MSLLLHEIEQNIFLGLVDLPFKSIFQIYVDYVTKKYGKPVIVFDGYNSSTSKDMTHKRQTWGKTGVTVTFTEEMNLTMNKDAFLMDKTNKQK